MMSLPSARTPARRHRGVARLRWLRVSFLILIGFAVAAIFVLSPAAAAAQDLDPPDTIIYDGPEEGSTTPDPTPTFYFTSTEFPSTFECRIDDGGWEECFDFFGYTPAEPLTDGPHTFEVRATDEFGNTDETPASRSFTVEADTEPPDTTIYEGPEEGSTTPDPTPTFYFTSTEFPSTFECRIDDGGWEECFDFFGYTPAEPLTDGPHTFEVRATDEFGNTDETPASRSFTVEADTEPPDTTITSGPEEGSTISGFTASFEFSSDEPGSFECELDDAGFGPCNSPYTTQFLENGPHTFRVRAIDEVENVDPTPASRTFTVDALRDIGSVGPLEHIYLGGELSCQVDLTDDSVYSFYPPGGQLGDCGTMLAVGGTVYTPDFSNHPAGTATGGIPASSPFTPVDQSPVTGDGSASDPYTVVTTVEVGATGLQITQTDSYATGGRFYRTVIEVENTGIASQTAELYHAGDCYLAGSDSGYGYFAPLTGGIYCSQNADNDPPGRLIGFVPQSPGSNYREDGYSTVWFDTNGTPYTSSCDCDVFQDNGAGLSWSLSLSAGESVTRSLVTSIDTSGDIVAPETTITAGPEDGSKTPDPTSTFLFEATETPSTFECRIDSGDWEDCSGGEYTTQPLADGSRTFEVRATDESGNTDQTAATRTWTIDTIPPDTTIDSGPAEGSTTGDNDPSFTFSSSETNSSFECRLDDGAWIPCNSPTAYTDLADGPHTFEVRATDESGNTDLSPASRTWTIDTNDPPTADAGDDQTVDSEQAGVTLDGSGSTDPDGEALTHSWTQTAGPSVSLSGADTATPSFDAPVGPATLSFELEACDPEPLCDTDEMTVTVSEPAQINQPPIADAGSDQTVDSEQAGVTLDGSGSTDPDGDELTYSWTQISGPTVSLSGADTATPSFDAPVGPATLSFELEACDPEPLCDTDEMTVTVSEPGDTTPPDTTIYEGPEEGSTTPDPTPTFYFTSTEFPSTFECRIDDGGWEECFDFFGYTPAEPLTDGPHTFEVRATDEFGNTDETPASRSFTVEADTEPPDTTITSGPEEGSTTTDRTPTFEFESTEVPSTFECRIDGGAWESCDSPYTTEPLAGGPHTFEVRATDEFGNTDPSPAARTLTVDVCTTVSDDAPTVAGAAVDPLAAGEFAGASFPDLPAGSPAAGTSECALAGFPTSGPSYTMLSSGDVRFASDSNDSGSTGIGNGGGGGGHGNSIFDLVTLRIDLDVPASANCLSMDFRFLSDEFPEFVGSQVNDGFVAELDVSDFTVDAAQNIVAPNNFAFDEDANVISVNTSGFSADNSSGTTYDGATALLQAVTPITPGDHAVFLSIFDQGDNIFDSTVFVDRFRLRNVPPDSCNPGATDDFDPPDTTIDSGPAEGSTTDDNAPSFTFSSSEPNSTFECRLDGGAWEPCDSPKAYTDLADGPHSFEVRATDEAGNTDPTPASRSWTIETNQPPTADAGDDQTVDSEQAGVTLDGTGSSDPDGDDLTYSWTQTAGPTVSLSGDDTATPSFDAPLGPATLTFQLEVCDPGPLCDTDTVVVNVNEPVVVPNPPVADAGDDQTVDSEQAGVTLDGTGSSDPDGDDLTYSWTQTAGPTVSLSGDDTATPSFDAPLGPATLTFQLEVCDPGPLCDTDTVVVNVNEPVVVPNPPVADAGDDQTVDSEQAGVTLDGTGSSDPDGDDLTYSWTQTAGPTVSLSGDDTATPSFDAPLGPATLTFQLEVCDPGPLCDTDTVVVNVNEPVVVPNPPVADAGDDQTVDSEQAGVTLDGTGSSDPDGDDLTYSWTQTAGPTVSLSGDDTATPSFDAPLGPATLTFQLEVCDPGPLCDTDTVVVNVNEPVVVPNPPVADAGDDQTVDSEQAGVTLDGTGSSDPDGDDLTYSWTQTAGPTVSLSGDDTATPSFDAPLGPATLTFQLEVCDPGPLCDTDTVVVNVNEPVVVPNPPVADAGDDQTVDSEQAGVTLDGTGSSDPDGDDLTYSWTQTAGPTVSLSGDDTATPSFDAPLGPATLTFQLEVCDPGPLCDTDTVVVNVNEPVVVPNPPVADAGDDQTVDSEQAGVTLDGTGSSDPDGDDLTYSWTQTAGPTVSLSGDDTATPSFDAPLGPATLTFQLEVCDPGPLCDTDTVVVNVNEPVVVPNPPVADAGDDQTVDSEQAGVTLDGTGSSDPDGDDLTYSWTQTAGPTVSLSGDDTATPSFDAPLGPATLTFQLEVCDPGPLCDTDTVVVNVNEPVVVPNPPVADAGDDQTVDSEQAGVTLDGTGSSDPDGDDLTYSWTQTAGPTVSLSGDDTATPSFDAPLGPATLTFQLEVCDPGPLCDTDTVVVNVNEPVVVPNPPVADAGDDQTVDSEQAGVTLDGTGSSDPDGDDLTYSWTQTAGPTVSLSGDDTATPSFDAPLGPASLTFQLTVDDGNGGTNADTVVVTVNEPAPTPRCNGVPATIVGTDGNDNIKVTGGRDVVFAGSGDDHVPPSAGNDQICGGPGNDDIQGGTGADHIYGESGRDKIGGGGDSDEVDGGAGDDPLLDGGAGNDNIDGGAGSDDIDGGAGNDDIDGGAGNDTARGEKGEDLLRGTIGNDYLLGGSGPDELFGGFDHDALSGGSGKDRLAGGGGKNPSETADNSSDLLTGGDGPDLLLGQGGRDGRTGSTFVAGVPGDDLSVPVPQLQGGDGVDHLHGGDRDDTLHGGAGGGKEKVNGNLNNILYGAAGTDLCSNGPLGGPNPKPNDPYAGTDRGDIRDPSCELPARGQSERVVRQGSSYVFVPFNIVVATEFNWDGF